jgi:hypothetical protein
VADLVGRDDELVGPLAPANAEPPSFGAPARPRAA